MRKILVVAGIIGALGTTGVAFAQTALPGNVTEEQIESAFKDLSEVYGAPIVRIDQAKAICNEEKYITDCAQIGKKHNLFSDERTKQVDTLLSELKGDAVEKLKRCSDVACLVDVANSIAGRLNSKNPTVAKAVELTPQKVKEKKEIVDTAKTIGVDIEACRTMNPETASVELLRSCARLAKHENVRKYISPEVKIRTEEADASIALKESLETGKISCGDNTLEGCGNFCLSPSAEIRAKDVEAIPPVCRQIAKQFFGENGVKELERAYTNVQDTFDTLADKSRSVAFKTSDGKTLTDPASIGRYMEEAGSRGDIEAVSSGMDFLVAKGFVTPKDREFALSMVRKINERGPVDFGACRIDPSKCADLISEEDRGQFTAMSEIEKVMKSEMLKRGISNPSRCSSDQSVGQSCLEAARAALPQIELLAKDSPQAQNIVSDIRQKIRFGEAGMEARSRVEERFKESGDFSIGERRFSSIAELEAFCRTNSQQCLSETAREGIFSRNVAEERYERSIETGYNAVPPENMRGTPFSPGDFNKEKALQQFKQWLDNPQGPPPMPPGTDPRSQYQPYPQYQNYPYQRPPTDQNRCQYNTAILVPCKGGEYRQESRNEFGCVVFGSCIPFDTKTEPPRPDGRNICPALPTVESCPAGEEKTVAFSSPECGTYYSCHSVSKPPVDDQNRTSCERYGSGWRSMDSSGNCFSPSMNEYRTASGALNSCASAPVYGCSSSDVPPSIVPPYPVPTTGQREQVWNSSGLRSWVRSDASQSRVDSLKQACVNVSSQANVWLSNAGTQSSSDFGMPDPAKCTRAAACASGQYFDGSSCTIGNQRPSSCGSGQYWNGSVCVSSGTSGGCGAYANQASCINASSVRCDWRTSGSNGWCQASTGTASCGNYICESGETTSCSADCQGYTSSETCGNNYCGSGETSASCPSDCSGSTSTGSCSSGQYWNGSACVLSTQTNTNTTATGSCSSELIGLLGSGCHSMGSGWFNSEMTKYVLSGSQTVRSCTTDYVSGCSSAGNYPPSQTSCPSGQYWNGSSCVQTSTTDCTAGQYWNGSACVASTQTGQTAGTYDTASAQQGCASAGGTWDSAANYCRMPSTNTYTPPPPSGSDPISYLFCPDGHDWNGAYCTLSPRSPFERYTASVLSAARSLFGF